MMSRDENYNTTFEVPQTMRPLITKGRGFENLERAEVPVPQVGPDQSF